MTERRYEAPTIMEIGTVHELTLQLQFDKTLGGCDDLCEAINDISPIDISISG